MVFSSCPSRVCNVKLMTLMKPGMKFMAFEISPNFDWAIIRECGGRRVCPDISQEIENSVVVCRGADKSLARPGRKQDNVYVRIAWISFGALPCKKKRTWWRLASRCCWNRASLTCFRACFPPGRGKHLSAPRYIRRQVFNVRFDRSYNQQK